MDNNREQYLIGAIKKASEDYYTTGKSALSDKEFDTLVEELESINPNAEILSKREFHLADDWNYKLETLPYKLYSIKKVKTFKDIQNWIDFICNKIGIHSNDKGNIELILTPKYDGIKLLHNNDGNFYTRYENGEQGYNVTNRISRDIPQFDYENIGTEGELIISKSNFNKYCSNYTSSRNFIPAIFSSKERLANQDKVEYIRYSMYNGFDTIDKEAQLIHCNLLNNVQVPYLKVLYKDLTEDTIIKFYFDNLSDFEYDGVVIDINQEILRCELGETQKYLDCCRAYKGDILFDDIKDSQIENITWQMSRYGKLTPVAQISPVLINEGVVTNVSLYNATYIRDNNLFIGQRVKVTRKGKINPKIVGFIDAGDKDKIALPVYCPFCGRELSWNDSNVDLICTNELCVEKTIQKLYFFFKTIGVQNFGLESVRAFVNKGFTYHDFFNEDKILNSVIEGIGTKTKIGFIEELNRVKKGVKLEFIQEASGLFQGISSSTLKILNTLNVDMEFYFIDSYYNEIRKKGLALEGIGEMTLNDYFDGLYSFYKKGFWDNFIKPYFNILKEETQSVKSNTFKGKNICFTGFRNETWANIIENNGGKILSSVTSICNLLVIKDPNSTSSKVQKAKQMGIQIMSIEDFQNLIEIK